MAFFEPTEPRAEPEPVQQRLPPWMGPPGDWLGVPSVHPVIIGRADGVVVALQSVVAYPVGCLIQIVVQARRVTGQPVEDWWSMHDLVTGHLGYRRRVSGAPEGVLRIDVQFADGRKATNLEQPPLFGGHDVALNADLDAAAEPAGPILFDRGGGAGGGEWDASASRDAWLWPLPPPQPFEVVIEWPAAGIPLIRTPIDGARVAEAAAQAQPLWPNAAGAAS